MSKHLKNFIIPQSDTPVIQTEGTVLTGQPKNARIVKIGTVLDADDTATLTAQDSTIGERHEQTNDRKVG